MASQKGGSSRLEWRLNISDGSSEELVPPNSLARKLWVLLVGLILAMKMKVWQFLQKIWKMAVDEPRRVIHCIKVGVCLSIVSLFYYVRPLYDGVGGSAMWAVMTVVVVFEYTAGGTLSKGLNRGMATFLAGSLAVGVHLIASQSGDRAEPIILTASVFLMASAATFSRFIPIIKARFDYGVTIFILTFSLVSVSGYRVDELVELAQQRLSTIAIGSSLCMLVSILVCPIWAGEELHLLMIKNTEKLANSIDACVTDYFKENGSNEDDATCKNTQGYKCILNSKAAEESLANFARWEPAHGQFGFWHPWRQYLKIGASLRYSACCIEALNASINSEIQAPEFVKKYLSSPCIRLSSLNSIVLKEAAQSTKAMRKSSTIDFIVGEMNSAVEELKDALKALPNNLVPPSSEHGEERKVPTPTSVPLMGVLPLVTTASLLIEIAARIEGVVDAVDELARLADFESADEEKLNHQQPAINNPQIQEKGQEEVAAMKTLQQV